MMAQNIYIYIYICVCVCVCVNIIIFLQVVVDVYIDLSEYGEESWTIVETCQHSDFSERLSARGNVRNLLIIIIIQNLIIINKKKRICKILNFAVPADHWINLKEYEKNDKYLDIARKLKKNCGTWRWQLYQLWFVLLDQ